MTLIVAFSFMAVVLAIAVIAIVVAIKLGEDSMQSPEDRESLRKRK